MNRWMWGGVAGVILCCMLPCAASARMPGADFSTSGARQGAGRGFHTARAEWPRRDVLALAMRAYRCGRAEGQFATPILTVIDYSLPSTEKRLWVIDLAKRRVLFHELVAHGRNSGAVYAVDFSNRLGSHESSLGLFRTDAVYDGRDGESLRLIGLEPGFNSHAEERRIVMHGAAYVNPRVLRRFGQLGRSWGCPAVDRAVLPRIVQRIKDGTALFAYYPDPHWLRRSRFLQCDRTRHQQSAPGHSLQSRFQGPGDLYQPDDESPRRGAPG
jgi:L,D-transpeptidase catalytic domain